MLKAYDISMRMARGLLFAAVGLAPDGSASKFVRFGRGQRCALPAVDEVASRLDRSLPTVWVHCSSLGEYGIARPVIREVKSRLRCNVVLTFFSPTGYEALQRREHEADAVLYLPWDTRAGAEAFLDAIAPSCAVFMVSDYWHNYIDLLHTRHIPTLLVSAIIRQDSPFFKWYGGIYRDSIRKFDRIFCLDTASVERLRRLGVECATVNGDPLFDNAVMVAETPWSQSELVRFAKGREVFVAGSLHLDKDLELTAALANANPDIPFIVVPHEITSQILRSIDQRFEGKVMRLSECDGYTSFDGVQTLVVDSVGSLAYLYRLGTWTYVGGGFTRLLHSVIEPVVYGLPVAFGPCNTRKVTPAQLIELGIGTRVSSTGDMLRWFDSLRSNPRRLREIAMTAARYVGQNVGATARVADAIIETICEKK